MKPIALFYHVCLTFNLDYAMMILAEQAHALRASGLLEAAEHVMVGVNGRESDVILLAEFFPEKTEFRVNDPKEQPSGEVPTLIWLDGWLDGQPEMNVCYVHMKGLSAPPRTALHVSHRNWRRCMEQCVIWNWKDCVNKLDEGFDSCGIHWHTRRNAQVVCGTEPYWAGNFWWTKSSFLKTLPRINTNGHLCSGRYEAEVWINKGNRLPVVFDFGDGVNVFSCPHNHWRDK